MTDSKEAAAAFSAWIASRLNISQDTQKEPERTDPAYPDINDAGEVPTRTGYPESKEELFQKWVYENKSRI